MATLFYLMGASGSGKDTLLGATLERLQQQPEHRALVPRLVQRAITRPADAGGEEHRSVDVEEFKSMRESGKFCMHWQAHGFHYGIPVEILEWVGAGQNVLVNGSRAYLPEAIKVIPGLVPVLIEVSVGTLKTRLQNRQRETDDAISARLSRRVDMGGEKEFAESGIVVINNEQELTESVRQFCALIVSRSEDQK